MPVQRKPKLSTMSANDASRIIIDNSIVVLLTNNSRGVIYDHNMFIAQVTVVNIKPCLRLD